MAFCYWYCHHHRSLTPDEYLVYYAEGNSRTRKEAKKAITDWLQKDLPRLHKRHHLVHIRPKGKRVNYKDTADDESNCITLSDPEVEAEE